MTYLCLVVNCVLLVTAWWTILMTISTHMSFTHLLINPMFVLMLFRNHAFFMYIGVIRFCISTSNTTSMFSFVHTAFV